MAGNTGDIVRVSLKATSGVATMRNVWFYRVDDPPTAGYLDGLLTEFQSTVLAPYAATQITSFQMVELVASNIFTGDEKIDVTPTPAAGTRAPSGDPCATFIAAMIVLERQNARVRNGRKFVHLPQEGDLAGQNIIAGTLTLLTTLANAMAANLNPGGTDLFKPAIVGRKPYTTSSGKTAYRLPATQGEMGEDYSLVDTARVINRVTSMNSRKFWRGE